MSEPPAARPTAAARSAERRTYWIAGLLLFGAIAALTAVTLVTSSTPGVRKDTEGQLQEAGGAKPHIIPRPGEGEAPKHPNDRGGWEQFMVLGVMVAAVGTVGGLAWRSSRRARGLAGSGSAPAPTSSP